MSVDMAITIAMHLRQSAVPQLAPAITDSLDTTAFALLLPSTFPAAFPHGGLEWRNAAGACGPLSSLAQLLDMAELVGTDAGWAFLVITSRTAAGRPFAQACGTPQGGIAVELGLDAESWVLGRASQYSPKTRDVGVFGFRYIAFEDELFTASTASLAMWDWVTTGQQPPSTVLRSARWRTDNRNRW